MQIKSVKKKRIGYQVFFDDIEVLIEEPVLLEYRLKKMLIIDQKTYEKILIDNHYYYIYRKAILRVAKNNSVRDFKQYLRTLTKDESIVEKITIEFKNKKYLDDFVYAESFVLYNQERYGKNKIRSLLVEKGVAKAIIDEKIELINSNPLESMLKKDAKSIRKDTYEMAKLSLLRRYLQKGFNESDISQLIDIHLDKNRFDEKKAIKKHYAIAHKKYQIKYEGFDLRQKIYGYLSQKGFQYQDILEILDESE